jgi:hypothetical protein
VRIHSAHFRAAAALLAAVAITAYAMWVIRAAAISSLKSSRAGQIVEQFQHVAPQIEQRDKEVDELTRP